MNSELQDLTVREADLEDVEALADIHVAGYATAHRGLVPDRVVEERSPELRRRIWRERLEDPDATDFVLVAELAGALVGFASLRPALASEAMGLADSLYWENLYIEPSHIGTPLAFSITAAVHAGLRDRGYEHGVAFVAEGNQRLLDFAKRQGWVLDGASRESDGGRELRISCTFGNWLHDT